jgi:hypothetical protein
MYILSTYQYKNPVLVHTEYILFLCFRTDRYQYVLVTVTVTVSLPWPVTRRVGGRVASLSRASHRCEALRTPSRTDSRASG